MTGFAAFPSFLPQLRMLWGMSGMEAGFVGGAFFMGYMLGVPFLSGATDRIDARRVFSASCLLATSGILGFALLAQGVWSGALFQMIAGAGLSGSYMPGLKALTDRVRGPLQSRFIAFYTATFGVGTSLSLLLAGYLGHYFSIQTSMAWLALGPLLAVMLIMRYLSPLNPPAQTSHRHWWPQWGPVFRHGQSRRYVLGYAVHCWELFGARSWMVAFFAFSFGLSAQSSPLSPTEATALINLFGLFSSILGNEMAARVGRIRWIRQTMYSSALLCVLASLSGYGPWWLSLILMSLYFSMVMADSSALTAGLIAVTDPLRQGATLAVYSLLGFGCGFISPVIFGWVLDVFSGTARGWSYAFVSLTLGGVAWALFTPKATSLKPDLE
jgi:MFS family permease